MSDMGDSLVSEDTLVSEVEAGRVSAGRWRADRRVVATQPPDTRPGAVVIGAMPAEWLATGQGMGYGMRQDANSFNYADIWASAARLSLRDANA